jgi:hypothetical protein
MNKKNELICTHSILVFSVLMSLGIFGVTGWMPVVSPSLTANEIAAIFAKDRIRILTGMSILAFACVFYWAFAAAIAMQMRRIEGKSHPLTYVQMSSAAGTVMAILLPAYFWIGCAFRPEVPPGTLQIFNDISWLMYIGCYPPAFIQALSIGICILTDKNEVKAYPRWVGFANIVIAILYAAAVGMAFDKTGPGAWDGIFGFWLAAFVFFSWVVIMWWNTVKAINSAVD